MNESLRIARSFFKTFGFILGVILIPVLICLFCGMLLLFSTASMVTDDTISELVSVSMENEDLQNSVSNALTNTLNQQLGTYGGNGLGEEQVKNTVSQIMQIPSVQEAISGIISESVDEMTSGSFSGEINIGEKLTTAITSDPAILTDISTELTSSVLGDADMFDYIATSTPAAPLMESLEPQTVNAIRENSDFQEFMSEIVSNSVLNMIPGVSSEPLNIAEKTGALIENNPELFETVYDDYGLTAEQKDAILNEAAVYAEQNGAIPPAEELSDVEMVLYLLDLYENDINSQFGSVFSSFVGGGATVPAADSPDIDYAPLALDAPSDDGLTIKLDEETTKQINSLSALLNILRSPFFVAIIILCFVAGYFLMALLTWSFRYPLLFNGIASSVTGVLLVVVSALPMKDIVVLFGFEGMAEIAVSLISSVWGVLASKIMIIGTVSIVVGILMITGFIIIGILKKNKRMAQQTAESSLDTACDSMPVSDAYEPIEPQQEAASPSAMAN